MRTPRILFTLLALLGVSMPSVANDGVFYANGGMLTPVAETDISVKKEILTITIGRDSLAHVDVYYEFMNGANPKTVTMAFLANPPYNTFTGIPSDCRHPYIYDFKAVMNSQALTWDNGIVLEKYAGDEYKVDFSFADRKKWKGYGEVPDSILPEPDEVYNAEADSFASFSYAYYFTAHFRPGLNIVRHTYTYHMSENIYATYTIPYCLMPAMHWANHQIDDFTLRIKSEVPTAICLRDTLFSASPFLVKDGEAEIWHSVRAYGSDSYMVALIGDGTVEWHTDTFRPDQNMCISSADELCPRDLSACEARMVVDKQTHQLHIYRGENDTHYIVESQTIKALPKQRCELRVMKAENGEGWLFVPPFLDEDILVYEKPDKASSVVATITKPDGQKDKIYPCTGFTNIRDGVCYQWYKTQVDGHSGWVPESLRWYPLRSRVRVR